MAEVTPDKAAKWLGFQNAKEAVEMSFGKDIELVQRLVAAGYTWSGRRVMPDYFYSSWTSADGLRAVCVEDGPSYPVFERKTKRARWGVAVAEYPDAASAIAALLG